MTIRKFYKTTVTVTVLSEEPLPPYMELSDVAHAIKDGDCSGEVAFGEPEELDGKQAADALVAQASDPGFFRLDDDGNDTF